MVLWRVQKSDVKDRNLRFLLELRRARKWVRFCLLEKGSYA